MKRYLKGTVLASVKLYARVPTVIRYIADHEMFVRY